MYIIHNTYVYICYFIYIFYTRYLRNHDIKNLFYCLSNSIDIIILFVYIILDVYFHNVSRINHNHVFSFQ